VNWWDLSSEPGFWSAHDLNSLSDMAGERLGLQLAPQAGTCGDETPAIEACLELRRDLDRQLAYAELHTPGHVVA
jgi:hypothetical protein